MTETNATPIKDPNLDEELDSCTKIEVNGQTIEETCAHVSWQGCDYNDAHGYICDAVGDHSWVRSATGGVGELYTSRYDNEPADTCADPAVTGSCGTISTAIDVCTMAWAETQGTLTSDTSSKIEHPDCDDPTELI